MFVPLTLVDLVYLIGNLTKFAAGRLGAADAGDAAVQRLHDLAQRPAAAAQRAARGGGAAVAAAEAAGRRAARAGTAVFLASDPKHVPTALLRNLEHNHVAHERMVFLNMEIARAPRQDPTDRVRIETLMPEIYAVTARFGFMETPDVNEALKQCRARGLKLFAQDCSFFLGWHLVAPRPRGGYEGVRRRLFAWMQRSSTQAAEFFRMPERRVIVLATQVEL